MKHTLIVYGKAKGHGKNRRHIVEFTVPTNEIPKAAENVVKWYVEKYKGLPPFEEAVRHE